MRNSMLLPAALLGLAGCVPVQVPAGSQVSGVNVSSAQAGSLSPTVTTTYQTPVTYAAPTYAAPTYVSPSYVSPSYVSPSYVTPTYVTPAPSVTYVTPAPTTTTYVAAVPTTTQWVMPTVSAAPDASLQSDH
jgi:hypothetical protein